MADTQIEAAARVLLGTMHNGKWSCSPAPGVVYCIFMNASNVAQYRKFSSGSWGSAVNINGTRTNRGMTLWHDKWTKGISTNKMLLLQVDINVDDGLFDAVDLDDDTLHGLTVMLAGSTAATSQSQDSHQQSIVRAVSGLIYAYIDIDGGTEKAFAVSGDDGDTWTAKTTTGLFETTTDRFLLMPGNETDEDDIYALYYDESAGEFTIKTFDATAGTWSESSAVLSGLGTTIGAQEFPFDAVQRHSDGHIIVVLVTDADMAGSDTKIVDITNGTTFSTKTDVMTNVAKTFQPRIFINQQNDDLYVAYLGSDADDETLFTVVGVYFKKSTDDAATWSTETAMSANSVSSFDTLSVGGGVGASGGNFMPIWFEETTLDVFCNLDNDVEIAAGSGDTSDVEAAAATQMPVVMAPLPAQVVGY